MNVLLIGEESAGLQMLRAVSQRSHHRIVAVMASPPTESDKGATVWNVAQKMGYPTWPAKLVKDPNLAGQIRAEAVDLILNIHSLYVVNGAVLGAARVGSFNLHPGPLPRYAGLNAVSWAIYREEQTHGVTIHQMVPEIDAGTIAYQSIFPIEENETALSLSAKCVKEGITLMLQLLETASANPDDIPHIPQDISKREYFGRNDVPAEGRLCWLRPAREIDRFVRACDYYPFRSPLGHPKTRMNDQEIAVVKATLMGQACDQAPGIVGPFEGPGVKVACADEWLLITKLQLNGRFLNAVDVLTPGEQLTDVR